MNDKIIIISKDILRSNYLEPYGQQYWETPNVNELAEKGTVFYKHYAAAPSSAMSYTAMFSGLFPHQLKRKKYSEVKPFTQTETLFSTLEKKEYNCHVIWDESWFRTSYLHSKVYGTKTKFHNLSLAQHIGPHHEGLELLDRERTRKAVDDIITVISAEKNTKKIFIWLHLPHVIAGRPSYGSDIDIFDEIIGKIRELFSDDSIYISADHGHMNLEKGIDVYGFHVYEGAIRIPLITPRINDLKEVNFPTSNTQLKDIILNNNLKKLPYVYSDTQYYLQDNRKLAIIKDNYKYIYNKRNRTEELYDVDFDPNENVNLLIEDWFDRNRLGYYKTSEIFYYPYWDKVKDIYLELKAEKDRIWREGSWFIETAYKLNNFRKKGLKNFYNRFKGGLRRKGKFGSKIKNLKYDV
jgi:hypothetical protein